MDLLSTVNNFSTSGHIFNSVTRLTRIDKVDNADLKGRLLGMAQPEAFMKKVQMLPECAC